MLTDLAPSRLVVDAEALVNEAEASGATAVVVLADETPAGVLVPADQLRP